jgi:hypothetical protein
MLRETEIVPLMLAAYPGPRRHFDAHLAYWGEDKRGIYTDVAKLVHYLTNCYERGDPN